MTLLTAQPTHSRSLRVLLFGLAGLCGALTQGASADAGYANLNLPVHEQVADHGLQSVTFDRRGRSRGFSRGRFSNRGFSSRNRGFQRGFRSRFNSGFRSSYNSGYRGASCQRVSKRGYWHGRPALIGGSECLDSRGYAYIAPNSRYLIQYH